jgi:hypothetical protein
MGRDSFRVNLGHGRGFAGPASGPTRTWIPGPATSRGVTTVTVTVAWSRHSDSESESRRAHHQWGGWQGARGQSDPTRARASAGGPC